MASESVVVTGELIYIGDTKQVKETFTVRRFVVQTKDEYPQELEMQFTKDRCSSLDAFKVGEPVIAKCNLRGRGYTNKAGERAWMVSLDCWRLDKAGAATPRTEEQILNDLPF